MTAAMKPSRVLRGVCAIFTLVGLWKPYEKSKIYRILYDIFGGTFLSIFVILYAFFMFANLLLLDDIQDLTNRMFMSLTEVALTGKVINMFVNNRNCQRMRAILLSFPIESRAEEEILKTPGSPFEIMVLMYLVMSNGSIHAGNLMAALSSEYKLAYSGWYPGFDWENNDRDYWIVYSYQYLGIFITCHLNMSIDVYYCFVMHMIGIEIDVFGNRLCTIQRNEGTTSETMKMNLVHHYKTHQHIKECIQELQAGLMWSYFGQVVLSCVVICSTTNELAHSSFSENTFAYLSTILALAVFPLQIFLVCYFGQKIITKHELLAIKLYESDWIDMITDKFYRKTFLIFMEMLKQDSVIFIGKKVE